MSYLDAEEDEVYPPLTPLTNMALHERHPGDVNRETWYACTRPESPRNENTTWDWRCPKCVMAAAISIINDGDVEMRWKRFRRAPSEIKLMSWMVARSTYWFDHG